MLKQRVIADAILLVSNDAIIIKTNMKKRM